MTKERRTLIEGLKATPEIQELEEAFVFGAKKNKAASVTPVVVSTQVELPSHRDATGIEEPVQNQRILPQMTGRIPVTTRCRPELASALKRASLQRQLAGAEPYYVQDIMEEAIEQWLLTKGYTVKD